MIISHYSKFIFIHIHRTGGTSFSNNLKQNTSCDFLTNNQHDNAKTVAPSFFEKYNDYFTFGFTRNP